MDNILDKSNFADILTNLGQFSADFNGNILKKCIYWLLFTLEVTNMDQDMDLGFFFFFFLVHWRNILG